MKIRTRGRMNRGAEKTRAKKEAAGRAAKVKEAKAKGKGAKAMGKEAKAKEKATEKEAKAHLDEFIIVTISFCTFIECINPFYCILFAAIQKNDFI